MRQKLQRFSEFANGLLPHETRYLLDVESFEDPTRRTILEKVHENSMLAKGQNTFDDALDKRKYSHLKNWVEKKLASIDVDVQFEWMTDLEVKIMTDSIQLSEEKQLLREVKLSKPADFHFTKFYELVLEYRHFLLIRMRYGDYTAVNQYLNAFKEAWQRSKAVHEKLHQATLDIVQQYSGQSKESIQWESWLSEVFFDESLDGHNRYMALVRLAFISFNYQRFELLHEKLDYLDRQFEQGVYYSKRLLVNYYNTRLMLHSRFGAYEKAVYYGYLSIKAKTNDFILYVNNLCAVLLRLNRNQEALELMRSALPEMKSTKNFHNRVGFVAFYVEALNKNEAFKNAESYAEAFLKAYEKEILQYRWHLFFSVYFESLLNRKQYAKMFRTERKYKLLEKDKSYQAKANYLPTIPWYLEIAKYKSSQKNRKEMLEYFEQQLEEARDYPTRLTKYQKLLSQFKKLLPEVVNYLPIRDLKN